MRTFQCTQKPRTSAVGLVSHKVDSSNSHLRWWTWRTHIPDLYDYLWVNYKTDSGSCVNIIAFFSLISLTFLCEVCTNWIHQNYLHEHQTQSKLQRPRIIRKATVSDVSSEQLYSDRNTEGMVQTAWGHTLKTCFVKQSAPWLICEEMKDNQRYYSYSDVTLASVITQDNTGQRPE